jgi:predicted pyridoxine 5'-phosphate oxidase superfamily flavin-nucleotide-binding protein
MGILTSDMQRVVRAQKLGYVASVCPDGTPNVSPKGTLTVWDDDHLVFLDTKSPRTVANVRERPAVEVNVVDPFARRGYRFKGKATVLSDGPVFDEALARYQADGLGDFPVRHVVLIAVEKAAPLTSPAYDRGDTEAELRARYRAYYAELDAGCQSSQSHTAWPITSSRSRPFSHDSSSVKSVTTWR